MVVIRMVADALSCQTAYCCPMTKTLVAVGRAASSTDEAIQIGGKVPTEVSTR